MNREFLNNFKIGDASLPKEVVDAIMAENGRDIEAAKKPFADYDSLKEQLATAKEGLKAFEGVDVKDLQGKITQLQADLAAKETEYQGRIADMEFTGELNTAITAAKGRNAKAITALLDGLAGTGARSGKTGAVTFGAENAAGMAVPFVTAKGTKIRLLNCGSHEWNGSPLYAIISEYYHTHLRARREPS